MPSLTDLPTIEMIVNSGFYTVGLTGIVVFIIQLVLTVYLIVIPMIRRGRLSLLTLFVICLHVCCYMAILRGVIYPHDITPAESDWTMLIASSIMLLTATTGGHLHRNQHKRDRMMADFTYTIVDNGLFAMIMPENEVAQAVWNETIAPATGGSGKVLAIHLDDAKAQIQAAGYTIEEAKPMTDIDTDELLRQLTK